MLVVLASTVALAALGCEGGRVERRNLPMRRPSFVCDDAGCAQRRPRLPDDGEWECAEVGVTVCLGGGGAAGVVPGAADPRFVWGDRRGSWPRERSRVCIDVAPDRPDVASVTTWTCRFEHQGGAETRVCAPSPTAACGGCRDGTYCAEGRCVAPPERPMCWLDSDCAPGGRCRLGGCAR